MLQYVTAGKGLTMLQYVTAGKGRKSVLTDLRLNRQKLITPGSLKQLGHSFLRPQSPPAGSTCNGQGNQTDVGKDKTEPIMKQTDLGKDKTEPIMKQTDLGKDKTEPIMKQTALGKDKTETIVLKIMQQQFDKHQYTERTATSSSSSSFFFFFFFLFLFFK